MVDQAHRRFWNGLAAIALAWLSWSPAVHADVPATSAAPAGDYVGQDVMMPMRDGKRLHAQVWRPKGIAGTLPILITRSPYGFTAERIAKGLGEGGPYRELAADHFIFAFEDIRGRFGSEGDFVNLRPTRTTKNGIDEATDTYDTIDWLVKHVPDNNGRAGVFGVSYAGWTAAIATIDPHPALKAVSSQASPDDMFVGDDFHHNGAFRLDYGWSWVSLLEADGRTMNKFDFGGKSAYDFYLTQPDLATMDRRLLGHAMPSWQNFVEHPDYDPFWKAGRVSRMMPATVATPNLVVAGWWDQEDFYGPMKIYADQEKRDPRHLNYLVVGPWNHGGWRGSGAGYGPFDNGAATGDYFRQSVELPWFRFWLKGEGKLDQPEALVFEAGSNTWRRLSRWPAAGVVTRSLYFHAGERLSFDPPAATETTPESFVSDPAHPVPYRVGPGLKPFIADGSTWSTWLADDQAPFAHRADVLAWQTEKLTRPVTLAGAITARLFASTTGSDADWVVKLIDVYPDDASVPTPLRGRQRMVANDVFRGRYRTGFETPTPIVAGKVLPYTIDLHSAAYVFAPGHRIAVQVQSSWFPLIDRNPQTFAPNIFKATPASFVSQTHSVYHMPGQASAITLQIEPSGSTRVRALHERVVRPRVVERPS